MGQAKTPKPVKLIVSAFAGSDQILKEIRFDLEVEWGASDYTSPLLPFNHTDYYEAEFGPGLVRRIWTFGPLIDPGELAAIKVQTNKLEQRWVMDGKRCFDLDPGYVSLAKLVLATTKNHGHRIYLDHGIYAEVTLQYRDKAFHPWPWTYPDYAAELYCTLFQEIRQRYLEQLKQRNDPALSTGKGVL
jgi:hypothetical protein